MQYTTLGRTGLKVSVAGLGCGGASRLGMARGGTRKQAADLVRSAVDIGINLIDCARSYGTEAAVGDALKHLPRSSVVLTSKHPVLYNGRTYEPDEVVAGLDQSLRDLGTDYLDIFFIHGLTLDGWSHAVDNVLPILRREQENGKFRFLAMSEALNEDPMHDAAIRGCDEDLFDVAMIAFSMMNQNARKLVFPRTLDRKVGTLLMCVVRSIFANPDHLRETVKELADKGQVPESLAEKSEPLDFLLHAGGATNLLDAAYRYGRHEPGADVILFGTGDADHMKSNVASILAPPLPEPDRAKVRDLFGHLVGVGLENFRR